MKCYISTTNDINDTDDDHDEGNEDVIQKYIEHTVIDGVGQKILSR